MELALTPFGELAVFFLGTLLIVKSAFMATAWFWRDDFAQVVASSILFSLGATLMYFLFGF